jgi:hypothetical protein
MVMTRKPEKRAVKPRSLSQDFAALAKKIKESVTAYDPPPADFDPLTAPAQDLDKFGFPPRPDPKRLPLLHAFWQKMFESRSHFERFDISPADLELVADLRVNSRGPAIDLLARRQSSLNWSGAYLTPRDGTIFDSIHGAWQVPTPSKPAAAAAGNLFFSSSTWIGLDGQRRYYQSSLPQIGTGQDLDIATGVSQEQYRAWWQWWARDVSGAGIPIPLPFPTIKHLDFIMANVCANPGRNSAKFLIKNISNGQAMLFDQAAPIPNPGFPALRISGATAEWILERPSVGSQIQVLPDYGTVLFSDCLAVATNPSTGAQVERDVEVPKLIDMYEMRSNPQRTAKISIARPVDEDRVMTVYR